MKFEVVDGCPVPVKVVAAVRECKRRSGQVLTSCFRGPEAASILHRFGKRSQPELYWGWLHRLPGFNPANPPGYSTHECHNDGPAFPNYRQGARIPDELVGQDWTNGWKVAQTYREMGIPAALTYPTSAREKQHVNVRVIVAKWRWRRAPKPLRKGSKGKRVLALAKDLSVCRRPHSGGQRYITATLLTDPSFYGASIEAAVKSFQRDHGLRVDGAAGQMTLHQIAVSANFWREHH